MSSTCPITYKTIMREQQRDKALLKFASHNPNIVLRAFRGGDKVRKLLCKKNTNKIFIPTLLRTQVVEWYHELLCHPEETQTELTIHQHLTWPGLRKTVQQVCKKCHTCQMAKTTKKKYGHLPAKEPEICPWDILCVDLIGPYRVTRKMRKKQEDPELWAVMMINPATRWFEVAPLRTK